MSPNGRSSKEPEDTQKTAVSNTMPDEVRSADEVKGDFDNDPANVSDGTSATPGPVGVEAAPDPAQLPDDQDELRKQIEETRAELGDTVEALSAKADVKGQAKAKVDEKKQQAAGYQAQVKDNPTPVAAAAGGVVALVLLILFLKRRGS